MCARWQFMKTQFKKTLCMKSPMTCRGISSPVKEKRRVIAVLCGGLGARPLGGAPRQSDGKVPAGCGEINQCFLNKIFTSLRVFVSAHETLVLCVRLLHGNGCSSPFFQGIFVAAVKLESAAGAQIYCEESAVCHSDGTTTELQLDFNWAYNASCILSNSFRS